MNVMLSEATPKP